MRSDVRLVAMAAGWMLAFFGVRQRRRAGSMVALLGLALSEAAMTIGGGEST